MKYFISVILFIVFFPLSSLSFEGLPEVPGNVIIPLKNSSVSLGKVQIIVDKYASVKSFFELVNDTTKEETLLIAFPFKGKDGNYGEPEYFHIRIDGNLQQYDRYQTENINSSRLLDDYEFMYQWKVVLKPFSKKMIECSYDANWYYDDPRTTHGEFLYVLNGLANWKGTIKEADIRIELPHNYAKLLKEKKIEIDISIDNYEIEDGVIKWKFSNWKPEENIYIQVRKSRFNSHADVKDVKKFIEMLKTESDYNGNRRFYTLEDLQKYGKTGKDVQNYLRILRNEIFARNGREFKSEDLKSIFKEADWYKPNPNYSDDMLNDIERKNIQFILEYEKKKGWK